MWYEDSYRFKATPLQFEGAQEGILVDLVKDVDINLQRNSSHVHKTLYATRGENSYVLDVHTPVYTSDDWKHSKNCPFELIITSTDRKTVEEEMARAKQIVAEHTRPETASTSTSITPHSEAPTSRKVGRGGYR